MEHCQWKILSKTRMKEYGAREIKYYYVNENARYRQTQNVKLNQTQYEHRRNIYGSVEFEMVFFFFFPPVHCNQNFIRLYDRVFAPGEIITSSVDRQGGVSDILTIIQERKKNLLKMYYLMKLNLIFLRFYTLI